MSIFYYLELKKWDSYLESCVNVFGDLDADDMSDFSKDAYFITGLTSLKKYHPDNLHTMTYDKFYVEVESVMSDELSAVSNKIGISDAFDNFLTAFYDFRFRCYLKGLEDDIYDCIDNCFNASIDAKNWDTIPESDFKSMRSQLMDNCIDEICKYFKRDFANYEPDIIEKAKLLIEFITSYDGGCDADLFKSYIDYMHHKTVLDLFDELSDYCQCFLFCDEDGNPSNTDYVDYMILDLYGWWKI